jgi:hypothetical protein
LNGFSPAPQATKVLPLRCKSLVEAGRISNIRHNRTVYAFGLAFSAAHAHFLQLFLNFLPALP